MRLEITRERDFPSVTSSVENLHASLAKYSMENKKYSADQWRKEKEEKKLKQQREYYERNKEVLAQKARERMRLLRSKKKNATVAAVKTRTSAQKADDKRANRERNAASAIKKKVLKQREKEREEKKNGEGAVDRNRIGRTFKELKGIRKIHSVKTTSQQCKVKTRLRSCMCIGCLTDMDCENEEYVDKWREVEMSREGDVAVTRQNQDSVNVSKTVNALTDLVEEGSTVAIAAADDAIYDYYLFKVTSSGAIILGEDEVDDYSAAYQKGSFVFKGNFFLRDNIIDMTYKLDNKQAIVYANTVRTICGELKKLNRRRNVLFQLLPNQHEEIMSSF